MQSSKLRNKFPLLRDKLSNRYQHIAKDCKEKMEEL